MSLIRELERRSNLLSVIQAIANRTLSGAYSFGGGQFQ
jgi:hypothetical protein